MNSLFENPKKSREEEEDVANADLLDMKNRLDCELQTLQIANSAARQDSSPGDIEELQQRIQDLQDQLLEESHTRSINELLIKRIQMGYTLSSAMFSSTGSEQENLYIKRSLEELSLVSQINKVHKETAELQKKLDGQKLENLRLKKDNMEMMSKLQLNKEKTQAISAEVSRNKDYKRLKGELEGQCSSLDIHRNLIQMLVIGMGQDWNQDPRFKQLMLECGEPLNL